jgi:hypothetical protein
MMNTRFAKHVFAAWLAMAAWMTLAAWLTALACGWATAQLPPTARPGQRTVIDSQITLGTDIPPLARKAFLSTPVTGLAKGAVLPAKAVIGPIGMERMTSVSLHDFALGPGVVHYPAVAMVRCSNFPDTGEFVRVIASTTVLRSNLKAGQSAHGEAVRGEAYRVEAQHDYKAGDSIPSVRLIFQHKSFVFSLDGTPQTPSQPLLSIAPEQASAAERGVAMEAWELSNQSAREGAPR